MKKLILNPDAQYVDNLKKCIKENGGYCVCMLIKDDNTYCPCKQKRENNRCICRLYIEENESL